MNITTTESHTFEDDYGMYVIIALFVSLVAHTHLNTNLYNWIFNWLYTIYNAVQI